MDHYADAAFSEPGRCWWMVHQVGVDAPDHARIRVRSARMPPPSRTLPLPPVRLSSVIVELVTVTLTVRMPPPSRTLPLLPVRLASRDGERAMLAQWQREKGITYETVKAARTYARVVV
jgi:hypothetical protein